MATEEPVKTPQMPDVPIKRPSFREIGSTGTPIMGGEIQEEYLPDLAGQLGRTIYDQMRRSDPQVSSSLDMIKLPIAQGRWSIMPSEDDPEMGQEIADFVRRNLMGGMEYTWSYTLDQTLLMIDFGFMPMEKVWEVRPKPDWCKSVAGNQIIWLKKLAPRMPYTLDKWMINEKTKKLEGMVQRLFDGTTNEIPLKNLVLFVNRKEGDNWEGRSVLRSAYKPWFIKDRLEKIDAIGHERAALGVPVFKVKEGYAFDPKSDEGKKLIEACQTIARNLHANQENFVIEVPGIEFRFESPKVENRPLLNSIVHHDLRIYGNIMAQFMMLGQNTAGGSRAVATEQRGPFDLALLAVARNVSDTFERFVIREMVYYNFGERPGYPSLDAKKVVETNLQPMANMIGTLCQNRIIIPDVGLEKWVRETLDLPAKVEITSEDELKIRTGNSTSAFGRKEDIEGEEEDPETDDKDRDKDPTSTSASA